MLIFLENIMIKRKPMPPRNHVVVAMLKRSAGDGVHKKTEKALRRVNKIDLHARIAQLVEQEAFNFQVIGSNPIARTINQNTFNKCFSVNNKEIDKR